MSTAANTFIMIDRDEYIAKHTEEPRSAAIRELVFAKMFHEVNSDDADTVRNAAEWIASNGSARHPVRLGDKEFTDEKKLDHLIKAEQRVTATQRLESWAAALYDTQDEPDVEALRSVGLIEGLDLEEIYVDPVKLIKFEDETAKKSAQIRASEQELTELSEKIEQGTGLDTVNVALAVRSMKPRVGHTVTIADLAVKQKELLSEDIAKSKANVNIRYEIMEALLTGTLSDGLRQHILGERPFILDDFQPQGPDDERLEELLAALKGGPNSYLIKGETIDNLKNAGIEYVEHLLSKPAEELVRLGVINEHQADNLTLALERLGYQPQPAPA